MEQEDNSIKPNKSSIIIGESNNTFELENDNCIKINLTENLIEYDSNKYKKVIIMATNYSDIK